MVIGRAGVCVTVGYDDRTLAGILFFFGSVQFFLIMLVCEGALPDYVVSRQAISDFGIGPTAGLFNSSVIVEGLVSLAAAYFYHRTHRILWITIPLVLAGIGPVGVGLFPENLAVPHALFAFISFVFANLAALLLALRLRAPFRYVSGIAGLLGLAALGLFLTGQYAGIGFGGMERLIVYPVLLWEAAFGGYLMAVREEPPGAQASPSPAGR